MKGYMSILLRILSTINLKLYFRKSNFKLDFAKCTQLKWSSTLAAQLCTSFSQSGHTTSGELTALKISGSHRPYFHSSMSRSQRTSSSELAASQKSISIPNTSSAPSLPWSMNSKDIHARIPDTNKDIGEEKSR